MPIVDFIYLCIVLYIIFNGKTSYKTFYMKLLTLHCFIEIMNLRGYFFLFGHCFYHFVKFYKLLYTIFVFYLYFSYSSFPFPIKKSTFKESC